MQKYVKKQEKRTNTIHTLNGSFFYIFYKLDLEYIFLENETAKIPNLDYSKKNKKGALIKIVEVDKFIISKVHSAEIIPPSELLE